MGNLSAITLPSTTVYNYLWDGFDRLAAKKNSSGTILWRYIYENNYRIAAQLDNTGAIQKEFVYATHSNIPDYMIVSGVDYRIITDNLGSPRLVVKSDDGTIEQRVDYNVLGKVKNDTNPDYQPFGFAGGIYNSDTGFVRFGARDYDALIGRWTTKDPIRFNGGDTNLYGYVLSDPINGMDPSGLSELDPVVIPPGPGKPSHHDSNSWLEKIYGKIKCIVSPDSCKNEGRPTKCPADGDGVRGDASDNSAVF